MALAAVLAACSSPSPVLYTIAPVQGPVQPGGPKVIVLQQISTAHYLERSQIVRSSENYRLDVMSNDWWGEPLSAMLSRVLTEELAQRLPQSTVIGETGAVSASPDATVELNVQRLDEDASGNVILQAQASISFKGRPGPVLRSYRFVVTPPTPDIQGEVTAISSAVGQLADGLALMLVGR
ncbi:MAG TPA: PqiC family protein [Caulobacteraceae bacterium]|nr:PqiC family protein [Caulobacteraceae bacterium]